LLIRRKPHGISVQNEANQQAGALFLEAFPVADPTVLLAGQRAFLFFFQLTFKPGRAAERFRQPERVRLFASLFDPGRVAIPAILRTMRLNRTHPAKWLKRTMMLASIFCHLTSSTIR
jgi:hypothetical protein